MSNETIRTTKYRVLVPSKETRALVLNILVRLVSLTHKGQLREQLPPSEVLQISNLLNIPRSTVWNIVNQFLKNLLILHEFLNRIVLRRAHDPKSLNRKVRAYLHLVHRFAPVFDYKRARINLTILHDKLRKVVFWPRISTQIAVIIFVTDKKDLKSNHYKPILQKNLRYLANCSAYAFHRTRNILKIYGKD
ncbi:MAG: hypothetical protein JW891_06240 [Candidatus Lokiarchaeota archaeon]|nr:hypothetical protein [Candidatus Lokiarchaeota archaeon]